MESREVFVLVVALIIGATLLGFAWQVRQGRVSRQSPTLRAPEIPLELIDTQTRFTLLQFSGPYCSSCAAMRGVLAASATTHNGVVAHREIDITDFPELTQRLRINQTPTTLIVTHTGQVISRIHGAARPPVVDQEITLAIATRKAASDEYLI